MSQAHYLKNEKKIKQQNQITYRGLKKSASKHHATRIETP